MNRALVPIGLSLAALAGLLFLMPGSNRPLTIAPATTQDDETFPLVVYCAASNRAVMESVKADYEAEFGIPVHVQYGASQTLLSSLEVSGTGDLYLPADESYLTICREKDLVAEILPIARMQAVLAVHRDNQRGIDSFDDLLEPGIQFVQANPDAAAIGKLTRDVLGQTDRWEPLAAATVSFKGTVNEVANDIKVGAADAGIVFDALLHTYQELKSVPLPELEGVSADIAIGVIASSTQPTRALHFARYLSASDKGLRRYVEFGFTPVEGDPWADVPELNLYAGSMLRPAIEETLAEFERREGVRVTRVYNGCGILVAQMRSGSVPDAYFACDSEFMQQVHDLFPAPLDVSQNELVILVPKGNPQGIRNLKDLTKPGLKVGIGHEKQCAMGWLTQRTLKEGGVQSEVMANVTVQTPTGDMLVNQMKTGSLDAAVVYISNAAGSADTLDAIRIKDLQCSVATQPYAVAKQSRFPNLARRLQECLMSAASREAFEVQGFRWSSATSVEKQPKSQP